ncbi:lysostaphin resistance protein A, partial [Mammaliicoccus sciuri]
KDREHQDDSSTTVNEINQNENHQQQSISDDSVAHGSATTAVQNHTNDDATAGSNYTEEHTTDTEEDNSRANIIKENTPSVDSSESDAMTHHNEPQENNNTVNRHTNSAVEASTEKAHPNAKDASPRQHDTNVQETRAQTENPKDTNNSIK